MSYTLSKAATYPRQPTVTPEQTRHPLYPTYAAYRDSMARQLVEASGFTDWLYQRDQAEVAATAKDHPNYPDFLDWMRETKAGARPVHGAFPHNFYKWLGGARW